MSLGEINIMFGWIWMCIGFIFGMILGMWAEGETWLGGYVSLKRRYLRLAHVAFIALPIINILYGKELSSSILPVSVARLGSLLMIIGAIGIPLTCISATFFRKTKYFLPLPASAVLVGTVIIAINAIMKL